MHITKYNINEFINGTIMNCSDNDIRGITHIDYIPEGITHLYCNNNELTELPKLPESLECLDCYNNNLPYIIETMEEIKKHNTLLKRKNILKRICA